MEKRGSRTVVEMWIIIELIVFYQHTEKGFLISSQTTAALCRSDPPLHGLTGLGAKAKLSREQSIDHAFQT